MVLIDPSDSHNYVDIDVAKQLNLFAEKAITEDVQNIKEPKVAGRDHNYRVFPSK